MRSTKKVTLSAIIVALGVVILTLGAVIELVDLTACAIASLLMVFVYIEIGKPYTWLVWICTALISAILFVGSTVWLNYLTVFGIYPLLKAYIERAPRAAWFVIKLVYINAVTVAMFFIVEFLFKLPFFTSEVLWLQIALYVLINVAFVAYDMFLTVAVKIYFAKIRHRFARFLK